jgi:hypothetical protein
MRAERIPTWQERCEAYSDSIIVTHDMIRQRMQEEIDDLRAEVERLRKFKRQVTEFDNRRGSIV